MNLGEMSGFKLLAGLVLAAALGTGALHYTVFRTQRDQNAAAQQKLQAKMRENSELQAYKPKLADMERQLANLKQQLEIERRIVPDEKEVDGLMRMVSGEADKAGVWIRRYTARPHSPRDFYTEVPFEVELDGPFYSMLGFFDRVGKLERIVNVSNLLVASTRKPGDAKTKHTYQYAPNESVVATCVATTYFSHDLDPNAAPAGRKPAVQPVSQVASPMRGVK
jgi:type IV pilus assembly protein PilO